MVYSGDAVNAGSTSSAITVTINAKPHDGNAGLQSVNPVPVGALVILTATVSPAGATGSS